MMVNPDLWEHIGSPPNAANDRTRTAFAVLFATECLAFIVRHELAHLVLGHCDFVAPKGEVATIEDTDGRLPAGADAITIQALEVAADGHSAIWGAVRLPLFLTVLGRHPHSMDEAHRAFQRTPDEAMCNYLLTMYFVFRLFYETTWNSDALASRAHAPAPLRFYVACLNLHEYFKNAGDTQSQGRLEAAMQKIWELGEFLFEKALDLKPALNASRRD